MNTILISISTILIFTLTGLVQLQNKRALPIERDKFVVKKYQNMKKVKFGVDDILSELTESGKNYIEPFRRGSLEIGVYSPENPDEQQPHEKDELYVIIKGTGTFYCDDRYVKFEPGDVLFVPAQIEHRFENFSDDFTTWVFFYGPKGGEHE